MLSTEHMGWRTNKLMNKYVGPFKIVQVSESGLNVQLELPSVLNVHNKFHVSKLRAIKPTDQEWPAREQVTRPLPEIVDREKHWEVERILGERAVSGRNGTKRSEYLVKWKGFPTTDSTWEPEINLQNVQEMIETFHAEQRELRTAEEEEQAEVANDDNLQRRNNRRALREQR